MSDVKTEFLFEVWVDIRDSFQLGLTPSGARVIGNIGGGTVEGPRIKGEVLNSGADWAINRPDGVLAADVRLTIRTDDGAIIYMPYTGMVLGSDANLALAARGELRDYSDMYVRSQIYFHTGSEKYDWLNRVVAIGLGKIIDGRVNYRVHAVV